MNLQVHIRDLCSFNVKANKAFQESLRPGSNEMIRETMLFSFGKINREISKVISRADARPELISGDAVSGAEALLHYANGLSESSLQEEVEFDMPSGELVKMQRYLMIQQIVVQSTYQRALAGMIS